MRRLPRSWSALFVVCAVGCGGVREDRTITFSADGDKVGFQHGQEGVFVADKDGGGLVKAFTPGKDVLATSTPLWSPNDKRLLFATARAADGQPPPPPRLAFRAEPDPAGDVRPEQAVVYTCWLRDEPAGDVTPEPRALFAASCDHVGYVAAGLAVRWHPDGRRVFYVDKVGGGHHAVFEFDLATKSSRRVFPAADTATALVFDWSPTSRHLVCVLAGTPGQRDDGIWVRRDDGADWWHVSESRPLADAELPAALERLRATRPAWTADDARFAFATDVPGTNQGDAGRHVLWLATPDGRRVERLAEARVPMRGPRWHPDGKQVGYVLGGDSPALRVAHVGAGPRPALSDRPVRAFAGWSASGEHLAYTVADDAPSSKEDEEYLLIRPVPLARDAVCLAAGGGAEKGRVVFSGMRATFLNWSPREEKLSLWLTFSPTHRSVLAELFGWGLRRGDPAAVLDVPTGRVSWMAVNPLEKAQVGHYYLLKRDDAEAWHWYEEAERGLPKAKDADKRPFVERLSETLDRRDDFAFFQYLCLHRLGREAEARAKLEACRETSRGLGKELAAFLPEDDGPGGRTHARILAGARGFLALAEALYQAEVFLSLDAVEDGRRFFRGQFDAGATDEERTAAALVLAQFLLLQGRHADYADFVTDTVVPFVRQAWNVEGRTRLTADDFQRLGSFRLLLAGATMGPLLRAEFLKHLPADRAESLATRWAALRREVKDDASGLAADKVLEAVYVRLGRDEALQDVRRRLRDNPVAGEWEKFTADLAANLTMGLFDEKIWGKIVGAAR